MEKATTYAYQGQQTVDSDDMAARGGLLPMAASSLIVKVAPLNPMKHQRTARIGRTPPRYVNTHTCKVELVASMILGRKIPGISWELHNIFLSAIVCLVFLK